MIIASGKRIFIKTYLRSTLSEELLYGLATIISIKKMFPKLLNTANIIINFATIKTIEKSIYDELLKPIKWLPQNVLGKIKEFCKNVKVTFFLSGVIESSNNTLCGLEPLEKWKNYLLRNRHWFWLNCSRLRQKIQSKRIYNQHKYKLK